MGTRLWRSTLKYGFATTATALLCASAAFACTSTQGRIVVTSGSTSSAVVGKDDTAHDFCSITGGAQASPGGQITITVSPFVNAGGGDTCPSSALYQSDDPAGDLWVPCVLANTSCVAGAFSYRGGVGPYSIRLANGLAFNRSGPSYSFASTNWCFEGGGIEVSNSSQPPMNVNASGNGTWTGNLPISGLNANGPTDASGICVYAKRPAQSPPNGLPGFIFSDNGMIQDNMAPIVIL